MNNLPPGVTSQQIDSFFDSSLPTNEEREDALAEWADRQRDLDLDRELDNE